MKKRRAFTLTELIVGVVVMIVTLGVATMSLRSMDQTAKRETERLVAYIYRQMDKAERIHAIFTLLIDKTAVQIKWNSYTDWEIEHRASDGCTYEDNYGTKSITYKPTNKMFVPGHITVSGPNGDTYYVILAGINEGRVRISDTPPD
ncbi:MAG: type II secretion system protein [Synergistaceae bacterium]|nr:type II secretion system protein [Synergistaceae bacterium]MBQ3398173.1 type II secretion system protein [Synergistaceae bacterium]MBQ6002599.1 type II secretion system protein [Synergistaceae bacterium]MBQ6981251.1 type II secretion system protein [Synergistaceae bacterium]